MTAGKKKSFIEGKSYSISEFFDIVPGNRHFFFWILLGMSI